MSGTRAVLETMVSVDSSLPLSTECELALSQEHARHVAVMRRIATDEASRRQPRRSRDHMIVSASTMWRRDVDDVVQP